MQLFYKPQMLQGLVYIPPDRKCVGVLSTKLRIGLANAFHNAWDLGYHNQVMPPHKDLNSELVLLS